MVAGQWKQRMLRIVGITVFLALGTATTLVVHQARHSKKPTDFPRSSWRNAAYADPASAFETAFWATDRSDGPTILASLTPELQQKLGQDVRRAGISPENFLSQAKNSVDHLNGITAFRIVRLDAVSSTEVDLHVLMDGRQGDYSFKMKKIGNEWKMDRFPSGF